MPDRTRHRSRCRIFADILAVLNGGDQGRVTHILHEANVPYDRLVGYLEQMERLGLIVRPDGSDAPVVITKKGRDYLVEFRKLEEFSSIFGVEV